MNRHPQPEAPALSQGRPLRSRRQRGLSCLEAMAALAVAAFAAGSAAPSFNQARERRHLEGAAMQLATDLRYARSLATTHRAPIRFAVQLQGADACYVLHTGSTNQCRCTSTGAVTCSGDAQALRVVGFAPSDPVRLASGSTSLLFDPDRGTVTPTATIKLRGAGNQSVHQIINIMGRVRACTPAGAMPGFPTC